MFLGSSTSAAADKAVEGRYTKEFIACQSSGPAAQGVQPAMNACAAEESERQDKQLNATYAVVMARQTERGKTRLRNLQRGWIKRRDATCEAERREYEGGSIAPLIFHSCMANEIIKRTIWLEHYK